MPSAWFAREVVFPLQERVLRRPTIALLDRIERTQWLPRAEIERLQVEALGALLRVADAHSPWHAQRMRDAGLDAGADAPIDLEAFRRVPTMSRADARTHGASIRWEGVPGGAFPYTTGGSSGQPLRFHFGRARQASDAAGRIRARRWFGVDLGAREVLVWGAPIELNKTDRLKTMRDRLLNQLVLNAFEMSVANMDAYLDAIVAFDPACIYGYASSVALLAARARQRSKRLSLPALRVVCTTGEPLYPHQRELIGSVFQVPVASEFGSRDIGFTAHESPQGQMLVMSETILLEVLDDQGRPTPPGEAGEAVITGLCSQAQPFIRYRTGDMVRLDGEPCRAGRGLHVLAEVMGRTTDFVVRSDGTIMHALAVIYVLRAVPGIAEFKIVQETLLDFDVMVVPSREWSPDRAGEIVAGLGARLGPEARIAVRVVGAIAPEASGKHRYVVSRVALDAGLADQLAESDAQS